MANVVIQDLTRKVGPLPVWGYGAIAGGVILVAMSKRGSSAASAALNPAVVAPALPGDNNLLPGSPDTGGGTGGTTATTSPDGTVTDITSQALFGNGTLSDLIKNLGPDYTQFDFRTGQTGVDVAHSAQNLVDSTNYQAQLASAYATLKQNEDYTLAQTGAANAYTIATLQQSQGFAAQMYALMHPSAVTPVVSAPVVSAPVHSCPSGNFSCIRGFCAHGDNACAQSVAGSWWNPSMGF